MRQVQTFLHSIRDDSCLSVNYETLMIVDSFLESLLRLDY